MTEYLMWIEYLDSELNTAGKLEYYLAQIAAEVRRSWVKDSKKVTLKDFLNPVKFVRDKIKRSKVSKEEALERSKNFWLTGVGLKRKK